MRCRSLGDVVCTDFGYAVNEFEFDEQCGRRYYPPRRHILNQPHLLRITHCTQLVEPPTEQLLGHVAHVGQL